MSTLLSIFLPIGNLGKTETNGELMQIDPEVLARHGAARAVILAYIKDLSRGEYVKGFREQASRALSICQRTISLHMRALESHGLLESHLGGWRATGAVEEVVEIDSYIVMSLGPDGFVVSREDGTAITRIEFRERFGDEVLLAEIKPE